MARRPCAGHEQLGAGPEEHAVGYGHGEDGAVGLGGAEAAQHGGQVQRAGQLDVEGPSQHDLAQRGPGGAHGGDGVGHDAGVAGRVHGGGGAGDARGRPVPRSPVSYCHSTASSSSSVPGSGVAAGPTAVTQRRGTPSSSRAMPMVKRGITSCPRPASVKGSAPSATGPEPRRRTGSSAGMAASTASASSARTKLAVPQPTRVRPGRSKRTVGLPSNCSGSGPYSSGTVRACSSLGHGVPVRVASTSWLRPPAKGRMPTPE